MSDRRESTRRLLIVSPWERMWALGEGAGVSDDFHFIRGARAAGWDVHVLAPRCDDPDPFPGATAHAWPNFLAPTGRWPVALRRPLWLAGFSTIPVRAALEVARRIRPDVVMGHSHHMARAASRVRRALGIPSVVKLFGVMDLVHTHWPRWRYVARNAEQLLALRHEQDAWIVLDDGTRGGEVLVERGLPRERVHFLPNGLDTQWIDLRPDRAAARARRGVPDDARVALFLARLVESKRPADVVRALPAVLRRVPRAMVLMAGDGPLRGEVEATARRLGVADRVRLLGTVPHDEVPELMATADAFVTTSRLTNMALPTCEAAMCGVPVVAYDTGETRRVVRDGETGRVVPDGDVEALARALGDVLSDDDARTRMGEAARALARDTFTGWDERVAMELEILERLIDARR